jgi:hypothetical protein
MAEAFQIQLASGRLMELRSLRQVHVYEGGIEGVPTVEWNKRKVEGFLESLRNSDRREPYLVPPVETPIPWEHEKPYRFGTPSALPRIVCVGGFTSWPIKKGGGSSLTVLWFQEQFALPIDPEVLEKIQAIKWDEHATDWARDHDDDEY